MLADLLPLMIDTVRHWHTPARDVFGRQSIVPASEYWSGTGVSFSTGTGTTSDHRARVIRTPGKLVGPASRQSTADAAATLWLIDHPYSIAIGDSFDVPEAGILKVVRLERRQLSDGILTKVFLT